MATSNGDIDYMNYINSMRKIEAILAKAANRPKRKAAGSKGLMAPRQNIGKRVGGDKPPMSMDDIPSEIKLARYVALIRKSTAQLKKEMEKKNA